LLPNDRVAATVIGLGVANSGSRALGLAIAAGSGDSLGLILKANSSPLTDRTTP